LTDENNTQETIEYESPIKPLPEKKAKSRFKRGKMVLCLVLSPGQKTGEFINLLKEENLLSNKQENQKYLIVAQPAVYITSKNNSYQIYVCDAEKGVTVDLQINRNEELATMYCDPHMISNIFDESFISKASNIKADWKQIVGVGMGAFLMGGMFGLLF